jgi:serine O-acetyltransferase
MALSRRIRLFIFVILNIPCNVITPWLFKETDVADSSAVLVVSAFTSVDWSVISHRRYHRNNHNNNYDYFYLNHKLIHRFDASTAVPASTSYFDTDQYITTPSYRSSFLSTTDQWEKFIDEIRDRKKRIKTNQVPATGNTGNNTNVKNANHNIDLFWEQIKYEAEMFVGQSEQQAGSQLYQGILSHASLMIAISTIISHEIATELITATTLKDLFINILCSTGTNDEDTIRQDLYAVSVRDPSIETAMEAILFHKGFHALVCYRVGHRLWQANRTGLAYYIQSTVSRIYATDIHPACRMGNGIYLRVGVGVVIGETAVLGNDVSIFEGVTLGGTGKESGDRHPKIGNGVIIYDGGAVLGNIHIGEGCIVSAKSIVTKPLPPLAIVSGVPAKLQSYRNLDNTLECFEQEDDLQRYLIAKYFDRWRVLHEQRLSNTTTTQTI